MPRITKITTRRGDDGSTDLASGGRIPKDSLRIQVIGGVDEANSAIGLALSFSPRPETASRLRSVQHDLFRLGAMLSHKAGSRSRPPGPFLEDRHVKALEQEIGYFTKELGPMQNFLLPNGTSCAAALHLARTLVRRAERDLVALSRKEKVESQALLYLNRLSDLLFLISRWENKGSGKPETLWDSRG